MILVTVITQTKNNSYKSHSFPLRSQMSSFSCGLRCCQKLLGRVPAAGSQRVRVAQVFDGWVMKGQRFPSLQDHPLPLAQRYVDYCDSDQRAPRAPRAVRSSQNVFMLFFHIHQAGAGFTVTVRQHLNPLRESPTGTPPHPLLLLWVLQTLLESCLNTPPSSPGCTTAYSVYGIEYLL